jgi:hypothetical protein
MGTIPLAVCGPVISKETCQGNVREWLPSTLAIEFSDGDTRVIDRTTTQLALWVSRGPTCGRTVAPPTDLRKLDR